MSYDPTVRTLSLYELPDECRWMLITPWNKAGEPLNSSHAFNQELNLDDVAVFYTSASGQASPRVTLREIVTQQIAFRK